MSPLNMTPFYTSIYILTLNGIAYIYIDLFESSQSYVTLHSRIIHVKTFCYLTVYDLKVRIRTMRTRHARYVSST